MLVVVASNSCPVTWPRHIRLAGCMPPCSFASSALQVVPTSCHFSLNCTLTVCSCASRHHGSTNTKNYTSKQKKMGLWGGPIQPQGLATLQDPEQLTGHLTPSKTHGLGWKGPQGASSSNLPTTGRAVHLQIYY